jgi:F-type H+-transporting ATPase subunit alpha
MSVETLIQNLKTKIENFESGIEVREEGSIISVGDGIARISGLRGAQSMEMLEFENGVQGLALNLEEDSVGAIVLGEHHRLKEGMSVKRTTRILSIPVGKGIVGRVVGPLAEPLDGLGKIDSDERFPIERIAPGVMEREPVTVPLQTGIKSIDAMIPIGRGQRELIIGDRQTGKTAIAIDTILNQKEHDVICVYVAIGQKRAKVARIVQRLKDEGALNYTVVVSASASDPASMLYIAPYAGAAIGEYFMDKGRDVLVVYDDLSKHAAAYREISLLLRRPPGREAYPGDVFYLHSRLLERACRRNMSSGGGSLTALPIIETQSGDVSAYIPTNVISITDGQIFLESGLFYKGVRPAVNVGISVSRVGGAAQIKSMKKVAGKLKLAMAQYRELEAFTQFASDLDLDTRKQLDRGARLTELLKQKQYSPVPVGEQVAVIYAATSGFLDGIELGQVREWEQKFVEFLRLAKVELLSELEKGSWTDDTEAALKESIEQFGREWSSDK